MKAHDILTAAQRHMQDRAATYDRPEGERSMGATVEAFRAVTGDGLMNTEERGWLFMELLKAVRSQQGDYRADNYEDGAAYFALMGEAAARDRKKPIIRELYTEADEDRREQIGTNGNEGTHYAQALPAGYSWADAPPDATVLVMSTMTGAYHWADAFSDGARVYGASVEQMGLTHNSGWKLIAHRPGSDPGWVVTSGRRPDIPADMTVDIACQGGTQLRQVVDDVDWADAVAYRIVEALEQ